MTWVPLISRDFGCSEELKLLPSLPPKWKRNKLTEAASLHEDQMGIHRGGALRWISISLLPDRSVPQMWALWLSSYGCELHTAFIFYQQNWVPNTLGKCFAQVHQWFVPVSHIISKTLSKSPCYTFLVRFLLGTNSQIHSDFFGGWFYYCHLPFHLLRTVSWSSVFITFSQSYHIHAKT